MARSNNKIADGLLASAHDSAVHDGLRLAVPRYLEAVDALVGEGRKEDATGVLAELLSAKEKKRGFFLGKRDGNPLGDQRHAVATNFAKLTLGATPTEESLDVLNSIALEFPDDSDVRIANADALRLAGYLLDALDEFKYCATLRPDDVDLIIRMAELYGQLGRPEEALGQARRAIAAFTESGNDAGVADVAARLLEFAPPAFDESFDAFLSLSAQSLAKNRAPFEAAVSAFERSGPKEPDQRAKSVDKMAACFEKLLASDRSNQELWTALARVDAAAADSVRRRLDAPAKPAPVAPVPLPAPTAPAAIPAAIPAAEVVAPAGPRRAPAAGGLSAFAKRKAMELFADSEYEAASVQLERVVKMSPDVEGLEMLLECYLALERLDEAARIGVALADAEVAAGNRSGAIATLTTLSKKLASPSVEQRRIELMQK